MTSHSIWRWFDSTEVDEVLAKSPDPLAILSRRGAYVAGVPGTTAEYVVMVTGGWDAFEKAASFEERAAASLLIMDREIRSDWPRPVRRALEGLIARGIARRHGTEIRLSPDLCLYGTEAES